MRIRTSLGALALGAAVLISAGTLLSTASAEETWDRTYKFEGISVSMREDGDVIKVCDTAANRFPATVVVHEYLGDEIYTIKAKGGDGTCKTRRASHGGVYNLPENQKFTMRPLGRGGKHVREWSLGQRPGPRHVTATGPLPRGAAAGP